MSGTALDHWLVRGYLAELDAALGGLPAVQARELKEQIAAHLDDALGPDAGDQEVAAALSRLGSPADLAAEAGAASGPSGPRLARSTRRTRWRLAVVIAVLLVTAATLGALRISSEVSSYAAAGRDQRLARLDVAVVTLSRDLEDERDLSGAYAARRQAGPVPSALSRARTATDAAAGAVRADTVGIGAGYPPGVVHAVADLLAGITDLRTMRAGVSSSSFPPSQTTDEKSDLTNFNSSAGPAGQQLYGSTVSGATVDVASSEEILAEQSAATRPSAPLTRYAGLDAETWYREKSTTVDDTRKVTGHLAAQVSGQADTLKSNAARSLLLTSTATLILLLVLLTSAVLARPLRR